MVLRCRKLGNQKTTLIPTKLCLFCCYFTKIGELMTILEQCVHGVSPYNFEIRCIHPDLPTTRGTDHLGDLANTSKTTFGLPAVQLWDVTAVWAALRPSVGSSAF